MLTLEERIESLTKRIEFLEQLAFPVGVGIGTLQLEDHNFRISSNDWILRRQNDIIYAVNETEDVWEYVCNPDHPELRGEQLFTWDAAMRETEKAGKRMPTDEEFTELLETKDDMPNPVFASFRNTDGSFLGLGTDADFWSSVQIDTSAWNRHLSSGNATVLRHAHSKAYGFSVRCLK
jgi:hypothetical protein